MVKAKIFAGKDARQLPDKSLKRGALQGKFTANLINLKLYVSYPFSILKEFFVTVIKMLLENFEQNRGQLG